MPSWPSDCCTSNIVILAGLYPLLLAKLFARLLKSIHMHVLLSFFMKVENNSIVIQNCQNKPILT